MSVNVVELRQKRAALVKQGREVLEKAAAEKRGMNQEEKNKYDAIMADVDQLKVQIDTEERQANLERELNTSTSSPVKPEPEKDAGKFKGYRASPDYAKAFDNFMRNGRNALLTEELRAMSEGSNPKGGYLVPQSYEEKIIELLQNLGVMRGLADVITTESDLNIPFEEAVGEAGWIDEEGSYPESDDTLGKVVLSSYKSGRIIKVSEELLKDSSFDLESYVSRKLTNSIGILQEAAFVNGNGSKKPTGVMTGTAAVTCAANNAITSDELLDLYYALKAAYRPRASFLMNDSTAKVLRKLKNGTTGDYMWQPGLRSGEPDMLLGRPVKTSDAAPAIAISAKVIAFGDFSYYQICDRIGIEIRRLDELYASTGQVGFRGMQRTDGRLTLAEAVKIMDMKHS